jgi:AbrB family looped-hinge helix DNA binding protein
VKEDDVSAVDFLTFRAYFSTVKATLTSKGQITIPLKVRNKLRLKPGDVLDFDEASPFLKATKAISAEAWDDLAAAWQDPFPKLNVAETLDELRGPVELPAKRRRR